MPPALLDQHHTAAILLAVVALTPGTAVQTVQRIGSLKQAGTGPTLAIHLADEISAAAKGLRGLHWSLTISLEPPGAMMDKTPYADGPFRRNRSFTRVTLIGPGALQQCGKLYAETLRRDSSQHSPLLQIGFVEIDPTTEDAPLSQRSC